MSENELFYLGVIMTGVVLAQSIAIGIVCKELCRLYDDRTKTADRLLSQMEASHD